MGWWSRLFGEKDDVGVPLYNAVVLRAREPHWYLDGAVPDTVDGRFDMIAAVLATVLLRLEGDQDGPALAARVTERFVDDMDGQLREAGIGDVVVGKHVGRMMGMLGGRLGAYREAQASGDWRAALERNLYRAGVPSPAALEHVEGELDALSRQLAAVPLARLEEGALS